jgi:hypothetical protein
MLILTNICLTILMVQVIMLFGQEEHNLSILMSTDIYMLSSQYFSTP